MVAHTCQKIFVSTWNRQPEKLSIEELGPKILSLVFSLDKITQERDKCFPLIFILQLNQTIDNGIVRKTITLTKLVLEMLLHLKKNGRMKTNNCLKKMRPVCSCLNKLSHLYFVEQYKSSQFIRLLQPIIQHFKFEVMPIELDGYNSFCWSIYVQSLFKCPPSLMPHCPSHRPKCTIVISDGTFHFYSSIENFLFKKEQIRERLNKQF